MFLPVAFETPGIKEKGNRSLFIIEKGQVKKVSFADQ